MKFELNEKVENFHFWIATSRVTTDRQNIFHRTQGEKKHYYDFLIFFDNVLCVIWKMGETKWENLGRKLANRPNKNEWN